MANELVNYLIFKVAHLWASVHKQKARILCLKSATRYFIVCVNSTRHRIQSLTIQIRLKLNWAEKKTWRFQMQPFQLIKNELAFLYLTFI